MSSFIVAPCSSACRCRNSSRSKPEAIVVELVPPPEPAPQEEEQPPEEEAAQEEAPAEDAEAESAAAGGCGRTASRARRRSRFCAPSFSSASRTPDRARRPTAARRRRRRPEEPAPRSRGRSPSMSRPQPLLPAEKPPVELAEARTLFSRAVTDNPAAMTAMAGLPREMQGQRTLHHRAARAIAQLHAALLAGPAARLPAWRRFRAGGARGGLSRERPVVRSELPLRGRRRRHPGPLLCLHESATRSRATGGAPRGFPGG